MPSSRLPQNVIQQKKAAASGLNMLKFPYKDLGPHCMVLSFKDYHYETEQQLTALGGRTTVGISGTPGATQTIILPLPQNITDTFSVRVGQDSLGVTGDLAAGAMSNATGNSTDGIVNSLMQTTKDMFGSLGSMVGAGVFGSEVDGHTAAQAKQLARRALDGIGLGRPVDIATGFIANPHTALMFEGADLKNHSFSWSLAPANAQDSDAIRDIVRAIKRNMLPSYDTNALVQRGLLKYPSQVDIGFFGLEEGYFVHFKTCMIQSFSTDYTPNGVALVKGGKPAFVQMTMQLMETAIHTSEDYA